MWIQRSLFRYAATLKNIQYEANNGGNTTTLLATYEDFDVGILNNSVWDYENSNLTATPGEGEELVPNFMKSEPTVCFAFNAPTILAALITRATNAETRLKDLDRETH